jgi:hypothetical protein
VWNSTASLIILFLMLLLKPQSRLRILPGFLEVGDAVISGPEAGLPANWNIEAGEITMVQFKGAPVMGAVSARVDDKLRHREMEVPVILSAASENPEVFFDLLVSALRLSISLRVVSSSEIRLDSEASEEGSHKFRGKLRSPVTDNDRREAMEPENLPIVQIRSSVGVYFAGSRNCMGPFSGVVGDGEDSVIAMGVG